ncbi:stage II sporulation protein P [Alkalihalophilus pseudofirmus OF4]|uniref:Stage II sporulation protein P n=2 Tax=Alkalihalophilus pseudofirmus TaxID=79885 RepID=D3FXZ3_ALKPO|nr:stage II sporulation protein P [Alkalihalophilus pseudofirmus]ADC50752.1 stage II sporulation protein P [Alkalihalophilus pseudofirmus OF4]MDV2883950.1 stage II sporulation protein P [Alkalihalophilus pseudofirmus]
MNENEKDIIQKLKRESVKINPRKEFSFELEEKLTQRFSGKGRKNRFSILLTCSFASLLFFILLISSDILPMMGQATITNDPEILIYHTHNTESFSPELEGVVGESDRPENAFHDEINVTNVGEYLSKQFEKRGIGVIHDKTNFQEQLVEKNVNYEHSYQLSRDVVNNMLNKNDQIKMMFDIHRDEIGRSKTTTTINDEEVARIVFIVSQDHPNYNTNLKFAENLYERAEEKYPGLSRGVLMKGHWHNRNLNYNQDLLDQSVLIEIGGYQNSFGELNQAAEYLAEIVTEYLKEEKPS